MPLAGLQRGALAAFHTSPKAGGRCFYTQPVLLKEPALLAQPLEEKAGSKEAGAKVKSEADSDFLTRLTEEMRKELPGRWVPLGFVALSLPIRRRRATAEHDPSLRPETDQEEPSQDPCTLLPAGREAGPSSCLLWPQEHPFPPHLRRVPAFLVELCARGRRERSRPRVIYGASVKSLRQRRVRSVTSCDVWVRTAWC